MGEDPPLPEDPRLRALAEAIEAHGAIGEVLDHKWRIAYITGELCRMMGLSREEAMRLYGITPIIRDRDHADRWGPDRASGALWWTNVAPSIVHDVPPDDPDFEQVFGRMTSRARELAPATPPPRIIALRQSFPGVEYLQNSTWNGAVEFLYVRIHDGTGDFLGTVSVSRPSVPGTLAARLARGDLPMLERMGRLSDPSRRPAAILFADLEASGDLSRRLSSRAYFELIRSLTDLIDRSVMEHGGIIGKHAGDGASALFVVEAGAESAMARGTIAAARAIREGAADLLEGEAEVLVNMGLHWGATLTIGQISAAGRLEVTALGDEMNEAARIEGLATDGTILASKPLVERLEVEDAQALGLDPDDLSYTPLGELGATGKALRDAGTIAVAEL